MMRRVLLNLQLRLIIVTHTAGMLDSSTKNTSGATKLPGPVMAGVSKSKTENASGATRLPASVTLS